jgi:hypothetical protein
MSPEIIKRTQIFIKYPIFFCPMFQNWILSTDFHKVQSTKMHGNPSSSSSADTCWRTDMTVSSGFLRLSESAHKPLTGTAHMCERNGSCPNVRRLRSQQLLEYSNRSTAEHKPRTPLLKSTTSTHIGTAIPVQVKTGPEGSWRVQDPGFQDNRHMMVVKLQAIRIGPFETQEIFLVLIFVRG